MLDQACSSLLEMMRTSHPPSIRNNQGMLQDTLATRGNYPRC